MLAAALATPSAHQEQENSNIESNTVRILRTAEALADHAVIIQESHPVDSIGLQLAGLSLVRSLHTIVKIGGDDDRLGLSLRLFDDLPNGEISSWLKDRIAQARMLIDEQLEPAPLPAEVAVAV